MGGGGRGRGWREEARVKLCSLVEALVAVRLRGWFPPWREIIYQTQSDTGVSGSRYAAASRVHVRVS